MLEAAGRKNVPQNIETFRPFCMEVRDVFLWGDWGHKRHTVFFKCFPCQVAPSLLFVFRQRRMYGSISLVSLQQQLRYRGVAWCRCQIYKATAFPLHSATLLGDDGYLVGFTTSILPWSATWKQKPNSRNAFVILHNFQLLRQKVPTKKCIET